jgi:hypothetical protein
MMHRAKGRGYHAWYPKTGEHRMARCAGMGVSQRLLGTVARGGWTMQVTCNSSRCTTSGGNASIGRANGEGVNAVGADSNVLSAPGSQIAGPGQ